jgi:hypothetical protein
MAADEISVADDADETVVEPEAPVDLEQLVWIVHPDVAVAGQVTRRVARDVWAESGWREANKAETKRFDGQITAGLRPTVEGEAEPIPEQTVAVLPEPMVAVLPLRAQLDQPVDSAESPSKTRPSRRAPKTKE